MKKLIILLAFAFVLCGCNMHPHITDYGVVRQIELFESTKNSTNYTTKYRVRVSRDFNAHWKCSVYLYTNEMYVVGDTIQVTRRTQAMED